MLNMAKNSTSRQLNDPPRRNGPNSEPLLFRKPPPDKIHSSTYQLGPKALEDAFETMRTDIANENRHSQYE